MIKTVQREDMHNSDSGIVFVLRIVVYYGVVVDIGLLECFG